MFIIISMKNGFTEIPIDLSQWGYSKSVKVHLMRTRQSLHACPISSTHHTLKYQTSLINDPTIFTTNLLFLPFCQLLVLSLYPTQKIVLKSNPTVHLS